MRKFIRENPTLAFGLALPLLLVMVFSLASAIPALLNEPPQYDVVFASNYDDNSPVSIAVVDHKAQITLKSNSALRFNAPHILVFSPQSESVSQIVSAAEIQHAVAAKGTVIPQASLAALTLNDSSVSPDGYRFVANNNEELQRGGLISAVFIGSTSLDPMLKKGSYSIRIPARENQGYYNKFHFIGWVVKP